MEGFNTSWSKLSLKLTAMRLYHFLRLGLVTSLILSFGIACSSSSQTPIAEDISIQIEVDDDLIPVQVSAGSTVEEILSLAGVSLSGSDRTEPAQVISLNEDSIIRVIRVEEIIETEQVTIPFEVIRQPTENLPSGQEKLLQAGKNGLKEIVSVRLIENGEELALNEVSSLILEEKVDEIILVGVQSSIAPLALPSPMVYLSNGNAWLMDRSTANRYLIVPTGDLDGRVFSLSDEGNWLLFTRAEEDEDLINSLWTVNLSSPEDTLIDLGINNVIHYADWFPSSEEKFVYSTVEPRLAAPGWQANNDLIIRIFSDNGYTSIVNILQETNYGGVYGWWGTDFQFFPDGDLAAYASPDQIGVIPYEDPEKQIFLEMVPYQTQGDWAWMPGLSIGPLGNILYSVNHSAQEGSLAAEDSPIFDLIAIPLTGGGVRTLVQDVGMFAYPLASPVTAKSTGEASYKVAYLQAIFPEQSATSNYRVVIIDRDGSNQRIVFPPQDQSGIEPSRGWGAWSPIPSVNSESYPLAVIYEGNIWILDPDKDNYWQVTGDGGVQRLDW
jgi:hypothetical protein